MTQSCNLVKNPRFRLGKDEPRHWEWSATGRASWTLEANRNGSLALPGDPRGNGQADRAMSVVCATSSAKAAWTQRIRCKGGEHYRFDVCASGECEGADDSSGFIVSIQPIKGQRRVGPPVKWRPIRRLGEGAVLRNYLRCPDDCDAVELRIGLRHAAGRVQVHEVRAFKILEPEAASHVLAVPPPPFANPPPVRVATVAVCTNAQTRPELMKLLRLRFGTVWHRFVTGGAENHRLQTGATPTLEADAMLLPDAEPPSTIRSFAALKRLARERLVIISPPAFAELAGNDVSLRRVEQEDDPIHAKVVCGNYITRGFALLDVFPFAGEDKSTGSFVQYQLPSGKALREFCERHNLVTVLEGLGNTDARSEQPICLYGRYESGGLIVIDMDPIEDPAGADDRTSLAGFLLLNALGCEQASLGQFAVPAQSELAFREEIVELGTRYPQLRVRSSYGPRSAVRDHVVEIGSQQPTSFGLALAPRPAIVIRTGLSGWDHDCVYGALLWIKQLLRPTPFACPYAEDLITSLPIVWVPLCSTWRGWNLDLTKAPLTGEPITDPGVTPVAAVIDVATCPRREVRVIGSADSASFKRIRQWMPSLAGSLVGNRYCYHAPGAHAPAVDLGSDEWRKQTLAPTVVVDENGFQTEFHRRMAVAGAELTRIEVPASSVDMTAASIWRTDLVGTLLETLVGLYYGLIAVNRTAGPMLLDLAGPLNPDEADLRSLTADRGELGPLKLRSRAGRPVLPPASCLCMPHSRLDS